MEKASKLISLPKPSRFKTDGLGKHLQGTPMNHGMGKQYNDDCPSGCGVNFPTARNNKKPKTKNMVLCGAFSGSKNFQVVTKT